MLSHKSEDRRGKELWWLINNSTVHEESGQRGFFFYPSEDTQLGVSLLQPPFQQHLQAALSTADLILQQWVQSPGWVA